MATRNELGHVRRSQAVGTHGPGAIVDFKAGGRGATVSVVAGGLEAWEEQTRQPGLGHPQVIFEPRLQQKLRVEGFRLPPVAKQIRPGVPAPNADALVGVQFPSWLQCPECKTIARTKFWNYEPGKVARYCAACTESAGGSHRAFVVPVRFIVACAAGHLDEFPWDFWVGHEPRDCKGRGRLKLRGGTKAGLGGLILSCDACGAAKTMEGCFDQKALERLGLGCAGRSPWLPKDPEPNCQETPRVLQRGASNIYFPFNQSALDIPPWSDSIQKRLERYWHDLVEAESAADRFQILKSLKLDKKLGMTLDALAKEVEDRVTNLRAPTKDSLRLEEYRQFVGRDQPFGQQTEFEIRPEKVPAELRSSVARIVTATRLREVRAIVGFTRIVPPAAEDDTRIVPIQVGKFNWLPAIELRGEGVFVDVQGPHLTQWEAQPAVIERAQRLDRIYVKSWTERNKDKPPPRKVTARLVLVHSVAHALMKQLALDCGYSAAALRERLYVDAAQDMAGLLIYTATPDSEGTLGGLARQGAPKHMLRAFQGALLSMTWCSSDPLCIDGTSSLSHQLNGAACHACMLAPETSCEEFNYLLDRALLVGTPQDRATGYFSDFIDAVRGGGLL